jgi:death-on-curing protein
VEPSWISKTVVLAIHQEQLAEHGGLAGLRADGALDLALARPQQLFAYATPDVVDLAAAYAFGLARNHPFSDGYKRTSFVVTALFLDVHGLVLDAAEVEIVAAWTALADGTMSERELSAWLRERARLASAM